jgi:NADH-quinone oxidoreductase subunit L
VAALGGLFIGWWVYGRKPIEGEAPDPLIKPLGPVHGFLRNKWYWDELYTVLFIRPTVYLSETVVYEVMDRGIIDGTLHLIARTTYALGAYFKRFEERVISDGVDAVKDLVLSFAEGGRSLQTGKIQEYVLVSMLIAGTLTALIVILNMV